MLELICASLISLFVSSTPITSSPWIEDLPIFDLKKLKTLLKGLSLDFTGDFGSFIPFSDANEGFLNFKFLNYERRLNISKNNSFISPILLGVSFGFGWTPCIGPILGSILVLATTEESLIRGIVLLCFYSLGLAIPFILSGVLIQKFIGISNKLKSKMNLIVNISGYLLLVTGVLILTNQLQALGFYLIEYFPILQKLG